MKKVKKKKENGEKNKKQVKSSEVKLSRWYSRELKVRQIPGCTVAEVGMLLVCLSDTRVDLVAAEGNYSCPVTCSSYVRSRMCILSHH